LFGFGKETRRTAMVLVVMTRRIDRLKGNRKLDHNGYGSKREDSHFVSENEMEKKKENRQMLLFIPGSDNVENVCVLLMCMCQKIQVCGKISNCSTKINFLQPNG